MDQSNPENFLGTFAQYAQYFALVLKLAETKPTWTEWKDAVDRLSLEPSETIGDVESMTKTTDELREAVARIQNELDEN
jgi:hypothetical protein